MKIKNTINFKDLRDKGANSLDINEDEVVQLKTKKEILCIVRQDYLLQLIKDASQGSFKFNKSDEHDFGLMTGQITGSVNNLQEPIKNNHMFKTNNINHRKLGSLLNNIPNEKNIEARLSELEKEVQKLKEQGDSNNENKNGNHNS